MIKIKENHRLNAHTHPLPVLILVLTSFFWSNSHASVYMWVDKNGKKHYSQTPVKNNGNSLNDNQTELEKAMEALANREKEKVRLENQYHQTMCNEARKKYKKLKQQLKISYIEQKNEQMSSEYVRIEAKIEQIKRELDFCEQNNY